MTAQQLADRDSPEGLSFRQALGWRRWHSSPVGRARVAGWSAALVALVAVHLVVFAMSGSGWSLLAVPFNPLALYAGLRGWAYRDARWFLLALPAAFVGSFLPFYLM